VKKIDDEQFMNDFKKQGIKNPLGAMDQALVLNSWCNLSSFHNQLFETIVHATIKEIIQM
jgi:hypothetical protein